MGQVYLVSILSGLVQSTILRGLLLSQNKLRIMYAAEQGDLGVNLESYPAFLGLSPEIANSTSASEMGS